jgi:hypothetical protein
MFGGGSQADVQSVKQGYRHQLSYVLNLSKRMLKMADQIEKAHRFLANAKCEVDPGIIDSLKSHAGLLGGLATAALKDPGSNKVTARNHHISKGRLRLPAEKSPPGSQDSSLVYLAGYFAFWIAFAAVLGLRIYVEGK